MLLATQADFEPANPTEGAAALYYNPPSGQGYREYPFFLDRVNNLKQRFAPNNQKTLIAGCGFGYLVRLAVEAGYDAWGTDASAYAITRGKHVNPSVASRLLQADALDATQMRNAATAAGIGGGNPRFTLLVTEDLLTSLTDAEITTALTVLRARCLNNLLHIVTVRDTTVTQDSRLTWKTGAQWKALLTPPDVVLNENLVQL